MLTTFIFAPLTSHMNRNWKFGETFFGASSNEHFNFICFSCKLGNLLHESFSKYKLINSNAVSRILKLTWYK